MQKGNKASILIGQRTKKFTDSQSNLLFSNQARALDGAIMAQFFLDCVIIKITRGCGSCNFSTKSKGNKYLSHELFGNAPIILVTIHQKYQNQYKSFMALGNFAVAWRNIALSTDLTENYATK